MKNNDNIFSYIMTGVSTVFTALQTEEVLRIISIVITCLSAAIAMSYSIYKWYKEAKKDGKISSDEIKEITGDISKNLNDLKENLDSSKKDDKIKVEKEESENENHK